MDEKTPPAMMVSKRAVPWGITQQLKPIEDFTKSHKNFWYNNLSLPFSIKNNHYLLQLDRIYVYHSTTAVGL